MYAIAIHGPRSEEQGDALAAALGRAQAEGRARLRVPGDGPLVVSVQSDREAAIELGRRLQAAGFAVIAVGPEHVEADDRRVVARAAALQGDVLHVAERRGEPVAVPLAAVTMVVLGTSASVESETKNETTRKLSMGRAALTGGLVGSKAVKRQVTSEEQVRERFALLWVPGQRTVALREMSLQMRGQASRAAGFSHLVAELRRRCTAARIDDRLLNLGTQSLLLGAALSPEEHLDLAVALVIRHLHAQEAPKAAPPGPEGGAADRLRQALSRFAGTPVLRRLAVRVRELGENQLDEAMQLRPLQRACAEEPALAAALREAGFGEVATMDTRHVTAETGALVQAWNRVIEEGGLDR